MSASAKPETLHLTIRCQFCETWNRIEAARAADRPRCGKCAKPILLDRPYALTEDSFARTIRETEVPVFVDFWAVWCGPCKMMAPAVDTLASTFLGQALIAKLDTDHAPRTSQQYNIRGIPTSIVFKGGAIVVQQSGALPYPALEHMVRQSI